MPEATDGFGLHALERVGQPPSWSGPRAIPPGVPWGWTVATAFRIETPFDPATTKGVGARNFASLFCNDQTFRKTLRRAGVRRACVWCALADRGRGPAARPVVHGVPAMMSVTIVDIWQWAPFVTLILPAGCRASCPRRGRRGSIRAGSPRHRLAHRAADVRAPGVAATTIFTFVFSWNEFLFALCLTGSKAETMPMQSFEMVDLYNVSWGPIGAAVVMRRMPMLVVVFLLQRHMIRGRAPGAVK